MMERRAKTFLVLALALAFAGTFAAPRINPYVLYILYDVGINIVLAVSLNLINGYTGQFSLGHAGFMAVGAYTSGWLTTTWGPRWIAALGGESVLANGAVFLLALVAGGLLASVVGLAVGAPSLRLKGDYLAIVTLGFGEIIRVVLQNMQSVGASRGYGVTHEYTNFFWSFGLAAVTVYVVTGLVRSTYGRGFIAVHDDEVAAEAMGINTTRYKIVAFIVGAFFAGIAGGLFAHTKLFISPGGFDFMKSIEIVVMVILGGMGNTLGVVIAAVLLTVLPQMMRGLQEYRMVCYSLLLIVLMLTCPNGLAQIWHRLRGLFRKAKKA